ncbi:MAG: gamma-glutamyl-gamma-aminobutyrate hydrolase family protein [Solobacterium sp.]|nr:gamma-glutamyl-gamma-aminobutyrate hydrolase family protein [Solobacterium sp.]
MLIGITSRMTKQYTLDAYYGNKLDTDWLKAADPDVLTVLLPAVDERDALSYAELCDGLLITGGADMDPDRFGWERHEGTDYCPKEIDASDILLYQAFKDAGKPILGVCRGMQVINVAEGGTLIEDIPSLNETEHNQLNDKEHIQPDGSYHMISCVPSSLMYRLFGKTTFVNSLHHQAVDTPSPVFQVTAYSPDGIIEAMENDHVIAVQWHPEMMPESPEQTAVASEFLKRCALFKQST